MAAPGPVRIDPATHTIVTPDGRLLRTGTLALGMEELDQRTALTTFEPHWDQLKYAGLNAVRLMVWRVRQKGGLAYPNGEDLYQRIDQVVDIAARKGMYVIIDFHSVNAGGNYNYEELKKFWTDIAPRYKDQPHVLYEVINEPGSRFQRSVADVNQEMHDLIRASGAPNMTILFSFEELQGNAQTYISQVDKLRNIDWTRTAVGYHLYSTPDANVVALRDRYPVMMTEWVGATSTLTAANRSEALNISWVTWSGQKQNSVEQFLIPEVRQLGYIPAAGVQMLAEGPRNEVTEGGGSDTYTLTLTVKPTANVTVVLTPDREVTVNGAATAQLVFTPDNWDQPQTVTLGAANDTRVEGKHYGRVRHTMQSSDGRYNGVDVINANVWITDNEAAPITEARLLPTVITSPGGSWTNFSIDFDDSIDLDSLDNADVLVTGPRGYSQVATLKGIDQGLEATGEGDRPKSATYRITAAGGVWDLTDDGDYTVTLQAGAVRRLDGSLVPSTVLATFTVDIAGNKTTYVARSSAVDTNQSGTPSNDRLTGSSGRDLITGGLGNDRLVGGSGSDRLLGDQGQDSLLGGIGNDTLLGGIGRDRLLGETGNDILVGGLGADTLIGGSGRDRFVISSLRDRRDRITDFNPRGDLLDLRNIFAARAFRTPQAFKKLIKLSKLGSSAVVRVDSNGKLRGGTFVAVAVLDGVNPNALNSRNILI